MERGCFYNLSSSLPDVESSHRDPRRGSTRGMYQRLGYFSLSMNDEVDLQLVGYCYLYQTSTSNGTILSLILNPFNSSLPIPPQPNVLRRRDIDDPEHDDRTLLTTPAPLHPHPPQPHHRHPHKILVNHVILLPPSRYPGFWLLIPKRHGGAV